MGWLTDWLVDKATAARANCSGQIEPYQRTLIPGDIGYLCARCGRDAEGGFLGLGHCSCGGR